MTQATQISTQLIFSVFLALHDSHDSRLLLCQNGDGGGLCVAPSSLPRAPCARLCLSQPKLFTLTTRKKKKKKKNTTRKKNTAK